MSLYFIMVPHGYLILRTSIIKLDLFVKTSGKAEIAYLLMQLL